MITPVPSDTIKLISSSKPKNFTKQVQEADFIVLDISQFEINVEEAEAVIKALKASTNSDKK